MSGVDNRIVTMQFNNRQFEQNARTSLSTLQRLKESMSFGKVVGGSIRGLGQIQGALSKIGLKTPFGPMITAANKGLSGIGGVLDRLGIKNPFRSGVEGASELQKAAQQAGGPGGMGVLEGGVTAVSSKFIALSTIAITALSNITNRAINAGTSFAKSFTIQPVLDGLHEYETNLKAIQTVQANTDRPLPEINKALQELNTYSDQTIYNFGEMAKNVGTFTAAGVDLKTSVSSIKGIANMAALSGSSSEQAATAMYQLSQAIASGKVGLMDWNSVVNAGMGGKKLQNALAQTAIAMGQIDEKAVKMSGPMKKLTINGQSFRESIMSQPGKESWLSSDILVNTLASLDGRFSVAAQKAELASNGTRKYSDAQIKANIATARASLEAKNHVKYTDEQFAALQHLSTQAFQSATQVKTLGQVFDIAKETIGSGWSASFNNVFGNLKEAKKLFTGMSNGLGDIIKKNALARNTMLAAWNKGGGRADLIDGLKNAWKALLGLLGPIKEGFRDIFPAKTTSDLLDMSERFKEFTQRLIPGKKTMADIRDIAGGVFAVFGIGKTLLGGVVTLFKTLFTTVGGGNGDFLSFAGGVGNAVKGFNDFLKTSGIVTSFFQTLGHILAVPLGLLKGVGGLISGIFGGFDAGAAGKIGDGLDAVGNKLSGLQAVGERLKSFFSKIGNFFSNIGSHIADALMGIGDMVAGAFTPETFNSTLKVIDTTLLGGLVLLIHNFFNKGVKIDLGGGLFKNINKTLGEATGAFENMQKTLKADILIKIAVAIGLMAGALLVLSTINPGALTKALGAMTAGFGILIGAMAVMMKVMGPVGVLQLYAISSAMTKMALSILILSLALKSLASIKFGDMIRGLLGMAAMLFILNKATVPLAANSKGMGRAAASLILLGIALNIMAVALKIFASMSWEEMIKGLAGLTGTLLALAIGLKLMPPLNAQAVTLIALGVSINILAVALKVFATMSWTEMSKGLLMLAGALGVISLAMRTMPKGMLLQAVALNGVAAAMVVLAGALKIMASMSWTEMAKGLLMLGGAFLILSVGLNSMGGTALLGAAALVITAGALSVLLPVLVAFGVMDWMTIIKSLTMLAGVFTVLGLAGFFLAPLTPVIIGLGAAMVLFGAGLALAGAGALAAATAFGIVVAAGMAGAQVLSAILLSIIKSIPPAMAAFGKGVVQFAVAIGQGAPKIATAFGRILSNLLDQVIKNAPKIARAFLALLNAALRVIVTAIPRIVNAGLRLIIGFLGAISKNLPRIMELATQIIVKFINGIAKGLPRIIQAGVNLIIKFVNGLSKAIDKNSAEMGAAGARLGLSIVKGMAKGIAGAAGEVASAAKNAAKNALGAIHDIIKNPPYPSREGMKLGHSLGYGFAVGISSADGVTKNNAKGVAQTAIDALHKSLGDAVVANPNFNPTITPVLDLTALAQEANKMSSILATAPIMPTVSYQAASDISTLTQPPSSGDGPDDGTGSGSNGGDTYVNLEQHLHSPKPIDSVEAYRGGKTLISIAKEALK